MESLKLYQRLAVFLPQKASHLTAHGSIFKFLFPHDTKLGKEKIKNKKTKYILIVP